MRAVEHVRLVPQLAEPLPLSTCYTIESLYLLQVLGTDREFVLKSISYDSVHRADLVRLPCPADQLAAYVARPDVTISQQQPWILQAYVQAS
jgi:hypothetical protein